jgi:hypothetical protein
MQQQQDQQQQSAYQAFSDIKVLLQRFKLRGYAWVLMLLQPAQITVLKPLPKCMQYVELQPANQPLIHSLLTCSGSGTFP